MSSWPRHRPRKLRHPRSSLDVKFPCHGSGKAHLDWAASIRGCPSSTPLPPRIWRPLFRLKKHCNRPAYLPKNEAITLSILIFTGLRNMGTDRLHIGRPHVTTRSTSGGARACAHQPAHGDGQAVGSGQPRRTSANLLSQAAPGRLQIQKRPLH